MDQDQKNPVEGAVGGEDDQTQLKLNRRSPDVQENTSAQETNTPVYNERPDSVEKIDLAVDEDIDLRNKRVNQDKEQKCNKTYIEEKKYEFNKAAKSVKSEMNIPVTGLDDCRKGGNNSAMAERQNSYSTLDSEPSNLHALSRKEDNTCLSLTGNGNAVSPSDNTNNLDGNSSRVHNSLPYNCVSASSGSNNMNPGSVLASSGSNNESRYSQKPRCQITDNTLVGACHDELIKLISAHLDGGGVYNWRTLLGLYNWTYNELKLFANKVHDHHYFRHILELPDFQEYNIGQLKEDLDNMPKKNTLSEVNEWIQKFNTN